MTNEEKDKLIAQLKELTDNYMAALKDVLVKNDLVFAVEKPKFSGTPFDGLMPNLDNEMLEDLFFELANHPECVAHCLLEKSYVEKAIAEYEDYHSPKSRILRHMSEIERLKAKYNVSDEDLKK